MNFTFSTNLFSCYSFKMSDDEFFYNDSDSGNVSPDSDQDDEDDYIGVDDVGLGDEPGCSRNDPRAEDDFLYEVLSTEKIVEHMVDCIKEVSV